MENGVFPVVIIHQGGVRIELAIGSYQENILQSRAGIGSGAGFDQVLFCGQARNVVQQPVAHRVFAVKRRPATGVVEQVLAGEEGCLFVSHVRILHIGRVVLVAAIASRIVNRLPGILINISRAVHQFCLIAADHVHTPLTFESNPGFALLAALGRYHHDAVGAARTPQGCRSGILQNGDRFHILRVQGCQYIGVCIGHPIDYDQRIGIVLAGSTDTADTDTHIGTGLAVDGRYLQTRDRAFQGFGQRRVRL